MLPHSFRARRGSTFTQYNLCIINMHAHKCRAVRLWQSYLQQSSLLTVGLRLGSRSLEEVCGWQGTEEVKGHGRPEGDMWPTPVLNLDPHRQIITSQTQGNGSLVLLTILSSLKHYKGLSSCFLLSVPCLCFSLSLAGLLSYLQRKPVWSSRVLLFWLSSSQTSGVHSSLTH